MLFAIHMTDRPNGAAVRASAAQEHQEFVGRYLDAMWAGGPLLADDGKTAVGSMVIMDFQDRAAATEWISREPFNQAGLFESVVIRAFHPVVAPH